MSIRWIRGAMACLAFLGALLMIACPGGSATAPAQPPDTTAPVLSISGTTSSPVSGSVTLTFSFNEDVGNSFTASDVKLSSGTAASTATKVDGTHYTLVVSPPTDASGTMQISVAAGSFSDLAGNLNTATAQASQAYDTRIAKIPMDLPVTFDAANVAYGLIGFGGAEDSTITSDPAGGSNKVAKVVKSATAETWAGTTLSADGILGFAKKVPFDTANTRMTVRTYSPHAGIPVRLKLEDHTNAGISVETEAKTTQTNAWEVLTFDFAHPAVGTSALDVTKTYDKASIFFNFGVSGATAGAKTYFFDDLSFIGGGGMGGGAFATITFDAPSLSYTLTGFGGAEDSSIVSDPSGGTNKVAKIVKSATAELWAGTTISTGANNSVGKIPFDAANTRMSVRVYSPKVGIQVRLKVENAANPAISCETEAPTTKANVWETLTFDFTNPVAGTAPLDFSKTYDKLSIFFDFGVTGATAGAQTYYCDDLTFIGGTGAGSSKFETLTFDSPTLTYTLTGFGGAEDSSVVSDPTGGNNKVAKVVKSATAELWAGTTISTGANNSVGKIPFDSANTRMTVRVYSPNAGIQVRLKVENAANPALSCETEVPTTKANAWETLTFDFANPAAGTAALDFSKTYDKLSIFFNFGVTGATAGAKTYYCDDLTFIGGTTGGGDTFETLTFDSGTLTYTLTGFGGAEDSSVAADPVGGTNKVAKVVKSATAELWAGTTVSTGANLSVGTIPFSASRTKMTVRVYSPDAGIQIRLKAEAAADPTRSVETEATTTTAAGWHTLTFDFAHPVSGTAALNPANRYNKISIFFNFGVTGATAGTKTYYFDDVTFLP